MFFLARSLIARGADCARQTPVFPTEANHFAFHMLAIRANEVNVRSRPPFCLHRQGTNIP